MMGVSVYNGVPSQTNVVEQTDQATMANELGIDRKSVQLDYHLQ